MPDTLIVTKSEGLLDIVLNRPESGNLIDNEMGEALAKALADADPAIKLIRLRGNGTDFCRGRQSPSFDRGKASAAQFKSLIAESALGLYAAFRNARAPILGQIQGEAAGVGCALAALCDLAVAADDARFRVPELDHGIPPTLVMSVLLERVSSKGAAHLVLSREAISARKAEELGIVGKVVPGARLAAEADELAARILSAPAASVRAVKEYLRHAPGMSPEGASSLAANLIATVLSSKDRAGDAGTRES